MKAHLFLARRKQGSRAHQGPVSPRARMRLRPHNHTRPDYRWTSAILFAQLLIASGADAVEPTGSRQNSDEDWTSQGQAHGKVINDADTVSSSFKWINAKSGDPIPENAVFGGLTKSKTRAFELYVCRAEMGGEYMPGAVIKDATSYGCAIPQQSRSHWRQVFQFLVKEGAPPLWLPSRNGAVPQNAVEAGRNAEGRATYVCRAHHEAVDAEGITPGKLGENRGCWFTFRDQEIYKTEYEVLVAGKPAKQQNRKREGAAPTVPPTNKKGAETVAPPTEPNNKKNEDLGANKSCHPLVPGWLCHW